MKLGQRAGGNLPNCIAVGLVQPLSIHDGLADGWDLDGPIYAEVADPSVRFGSKAVIQSMSALRQ